MKADRLALVFSLSLLVLNLAHGKPKKPDVPAVFKNARYVYVEAVDGDILNPRLLPEDRQAITDVEDSLRQWNRYALTINRNEAELVFVVRKGRLASAGLHGGVSAGSRVPPGQSSPAPGQGRTTEVGASGEIGPPDDLLRVHLQDQGQLSTIVWYRSMEGGLNAPAVQLLKQLKSAVENAYPQTPNPNQKP
jgi:hypothetical protein